MYSLRRLRKHALATTIITIVSTCVLISVKEGFKIVHIQPNGVTIGKRGEATITLSLPWKSPSDNRLATPPTLETVAGGDTVPSGIDSAKSAVQDVDKLLSVAISKDSNKVSIAASLLGEATAIIGIVIDESSTTIRDSSAAAANPSATGGSSNHNTTSFCNSVSSMTSLPLAYTSPTSFKNSSAHASSFTRNTTLAASRSFTAPSSTYCCTPPSIPTSSGTFLFVCPNTVTETWHSTHYESTATMYSFMNTMTVTYTETVSVCASPDLFSFMANATLSPSSIPCPSPPLSPSATLYPSPPFSPFSVLPYPAPSPFPTACKNGAIAEFGKDCPPSLVPSNSAILCKDKDCDLPLIPFISTRSSTCSTSGPLSTGATLDQAVGEIESAYGSTLSGHGGSPLKDIRAVDHLKRKRLSDAKISVAPPSPHLPTVTLQVKPVLVERPSTTNVASLAGVLNGATARRRSVAGENREG